MLFALSILHVFRNKDISLIDIQLASSLLNHLLNKLVNESIKTAAISKSLVFKTVINEKHVHRGI